MNSTWNETWALLEKANKQLNEYLELKDENKLKRFVDSWRKILTKAEKIDLYFQPNLLPIERELPFKSERFAELWTRWKEYLQQEHGRLMSDRAELSALELLTKELANGNEEQACFILVHAMSGGAKNFYLVTKAQTHEPEKVEVDERF